MVVRVGTIFTNFKLNNRGLTQSPATSKMELFHTLLDDFQPLTNVTKNSILDVVRVR